MGVVARSLAAVAAAVFAAGAPPPSVAATPAPRPPAPAPTAAPAGPVAVHYRAPVDARVIDPFRPPSNPYAAGNRGIDYGVTPGTPVRAAATGVVVFAGQV